ncbi:hypothetical protein Lal_00000555 [Lupinus albus]|nr:hypothetical protein Lal_00000555 [Lupinus albus]
MNSMKIPRALETELVEPFLASPNMNSKRVSLKVQSATMVADARSVADRGSNSGIVIIALRGIEGSGPNYL